MEYAFPVCANIRDSEVEQFIKSSDSESSKDNRG